MKLRLLVLCIIAFVSMPALAQEKADEPALRSLFAVELMEARAGGTSVLGATLTEVTTPPEIPGYALNMIAHFEGWFPQKYDDPAGYCTIGFGRLFAKKTCASLTEAEIKAHVTMDEWANGISEERGLELLSEDLLIARRFVGKVVTVETSADQFGSLVSFAFNVGGGNLQRSTLLSKTNKKDFSGAQREFARWVRAGGTVLRGLQIRRSCEAMLFSGALSKRKSEEFSRLECQSFGATSDVSALVDIETGE
ncbi:lysozyme [Tabrizicola sp.]|uniref:lysozyme n=1 Tax=Tabrizicola sp. TaxID=2005166 RepID=UPI0035B0DDDD